MERRARREECPDFPVRGALEEETFGSSSFLLCFLFRLLPAEEVLLLLQRQVLLEEEPEGATSMASADASANDGIPGRGVSPEELHKLAVAPLRRGLSETARPHPRRWCLLSLWGCVRVLHHLLSVG